MDPINLDASTIRLLHHSGGGTGKPLGGSQGGGDNDGGGLRIKGGHVNVIPPYSPLLVLGN